MFLEPRRFSETEAFRIATLSERERAGGNAVRADILLMSAWLAYDREADCNVVAFPRPGMAHF